MCRSTNAFSIRHSYMEWCGVPMRVKVARMKNDHSGARPRDPRHVHANPSQPAIWPILTLAIYWATTTFDEDNRLFPRSDQYDHFQKGVQRLLIDVELSVKLNRRGVNTSNLETHLMRKGAWLSSTVVREGVQNTYHRYEAAGDMHVGRTVTGILSSNHELAILQPNFQ
ncbi:hypothetical protein PHMEG_00025184 [Phytophthora megakarya]|uniref:Uncharacterized protein n=1 Tax=Phytophthora megakarya TaxID=4795 RepID=A0A225VBQ4_9STRA|nr:hypothetical protein PHMEG_00025184 [Phytophthora megakarya]